MAIADGFEAPSSAEDLPVPLESTAPFFILFLASIDPVTNEAWCSDVRASLPLLNKIFAKSSSPDVHYVYVGSRAEYKENLRNKFRADWNIKNIPALVRYERTDGVVKEVSRLVENELLDEGRIVHLIR